MVVFGTREESFRGDEKGISINWKNRPILTVDVRADIFHSVDEHERRSHRVNFGLLYDCGEGIFCIVAVDVNVSCTSSTVIQYDRMKRISYSMLVKDRIARIFLFYDGHGRISYSVTWMYASWWIFRFHGDT